MLSRTALFVGIGILSALVLGAIKGRHTNSAHAIKLVVHNKGHKKQWNAQSTDGAALLSASEKSLTTSNDTLRVLLGPEKIQALRDSQISIEIVYPEARIFFLPKLNKSVMADRILIPLTGQFAESSSHEKYTTAFCGEGEYTIGPFTNTQEVHEELADRLRKMGYKPD